MSLPVLSLQNFDLSNPEQAKQYQYQLMQFLNGFVNQFNTLQSQAAGLSPSTTNLGSVGVNTAVQTNGSFFVLVTLTITAAITLTLNNLASGAVVVIQPTSSGTHILKLAATNPSGAAYTSIKLTYAGSGTLIDMLGAGQSIGAAASVTYAGLASNLQVNLVGS